MSSQNSPDTKPEFTRRSDTEGVCMCCFQTIKTDRYAPLEYVEDIHVRLPPGLRQPAKTLFAVR